MMVSLKGLPDTLRSAAWPSSVRAVKPFLSYKKKNPWEKKTIRKRLRKSVLLSQETNETYAISCYLPLRRQSTLMGPLLLKQRKE